MDLSQLDLILQCEDDCSLTHIELDDVVPIEMDPQNNGNGNEIVADEQLNDSVVNCRSKAKLIDGDKLVEEPKNGMLFGSIEEVLDYNRNYAKQAGFGVIQKKKKKYENGDVHYITLTSARGGKASSSSRHNHDLSPGKARYFRCNKKLNPATKKKLDINDRAGICTNKIYNSLADEAGGYENLTFGERECHNYIANSRRLGIECAAALRDYFNRMRKVNDDFYFGIDVDDECRLRNVFWANARSRASYEDFGDVVTFDTTYLTNKYEMSFVPFVGVNHHGQSILFGAALISSEDTASFVWLFKAWLKCMKGRVPRAIITDQDRAMKNAINKENAWLHDLYSKQTFWVPAYLNGVFWADMTITQRSENMNAFFDGYVHSSTSLKEFVYQYDNALRMKVEVENVADFDSFNTTISCVSYCPLEKQFQKIYTHAKFKEVQKEISEHAISVLTTFEDVDLLPEKYFLNRWRKDLKRSYKLIKSSYDPLSGNPTTDRYAELSKNVLKLATIAAPNVDHCTEVQNYVDMLIKKFSGPSCEQSQSSQSLPSAKDLPSAPMIDDGDMDCMAVEVCSPLVARTKGKRPSTRKVSVVEKAVGKKSKGGSKKQSNTNPELQRKKEEEVFVPHCNFAILSMQGRVKIWEVIVGVANLVD
ncbi:protein FAR-RED IMPAIRED RESPONSE 1-like [Alnus glutinosa]|uniref:protein FAR-RED IMPAIRED RESPONSE 1-like n=1 Tax=Alnus glutinosa TaxID=3517 RepID=UPI002D77C4DF|nr:protein FAR-RED IMPAIRED RESPONSE 1-like [Alnus glutinosa]